jgi:hypothetical protein
MVEIKGDFGSESTYEIYDLRGMKIGFGPFFESKMIDLSHLESAVYFIKIGVKTKRIHLVK